MGCLPRVAAAYGAGGAEEDLYAAGRHLSPPPRDGGGLSPDDQQVQDAILQWRQWSYYHLRYKEIP